MITIIILSIILIAATLGSIAFISLFYNSAILCMKSKDYFSSFSYAFFIVAVLLIYSILIQMLYTAYSVAIF